MLFLAYRNYYSRLGVDPEEVGVDNAYILSRSLGFVLVIGLFVVCAVATIAIDSVETPDTWIGVLATAGVAAVKIFLALPFGLFLFQVINPDLPSTLRAVISVLAISPQVVAISKLRRISNWAEFTVYFALIVLGVIVATIALVTRAHFAANQVLEGGSAAPIEYGSVPILDVASPLVEVTWTGTAAQRPQFFPPSGSLSGRLIGHDSVAEFVLVGNAPKTTLVRLPTTTTTTETLLEPPT